MNKTTHLQVIDTIYLFTKTGSRCDSVTIGERISESPQLVERSLAHLDRRGMLDRVRVRLTFTGLALATALHAEKTGRPERVCRAA